MVGREGGNRWQVGGETNHFFFRRGGWGETVLVKFLSIEFDFNFALKL